MSLPRLWKEAEAFGQERGTVELIRLELLACVVCPGFKADSLSRPLAVKMKTSLGGVGKDRDEAFPCESC